MVLANVTPQPNPEFHNLQRQQSTTVPFKTVLVPEWGY